ncbi:MAG: EAL domain-containing protein, partial [Methylophaga sp.]
LKGTPCENVINGGLCCYPNDVRQRFPDDQMLFDMSVESYIGLPLWDSTGKVIGLIMVMDSKPIEDEAAVTGLLQLVGTRVAAELEREGSERALKAREQEYRRLLEDSPDVIIRYDDQCRRTYSNAAHRRIMPKPVSLGTTPVEDWGLPTGIEVAEAYQAHLHNVLESGMPDEWELAWHDADDNLICYLVRGSLEFDQHAEAVGVMVVGRDISARKHLEAATIAREQEFRALADNSPDFITRFDKNCCRTYINPSLAVLLDAEKSLGKTPTEYYPDSGSAEEYEAWVRYVLESGEESQFVFNFSGKDGRQYCSDMRIVPERNGSGEIVGVLAIGRDISERLHLEEELRRQASYDALSGLPNRWSFGDRLRDEIIKAKRSGSQVALLFIDLDRFKEVNDTLGHEVGDQLLLEAAQRIQLCVRQSDIVARLGGDEFVVSLPVETDTMHIGGLAQKIIDAITQPFTLNEHLAYVSASIGIATYPSDAEDAETLLSCADQAMYAAKNRGRSGFSFFTPSMQAQAESRIHLANDLRDALSQQQFEVYYQPIVDISSGKVVKAEALLRWRHPVRGMVSPELFIPVAEDTGIIHELGDWVFHEAVKVVMLWREQWRNECVQVSINISPRQFMHGQNFESWLSYLNNIGLPGECLAIEITEGLLLDDQDGVKEKLAKFRDAGIRLALDDFGTGYSAMAYLKKFNIDYLKIDRSFVRDLAIDESDRAIAETIVVMANKLGMKAIAEGIETVEQRDMLVAVGCEYAQGYLYSPAIPADEFLAYVATNMAAEGAK